MTTQHREMWYRCPHCTQVTEDRDMKRDHEAGRTFVSCPNCGTRLRDRRVAMRHDCDDDGQQGVVDLIEIPSDGKSRLPDQVRKIQRNAIAYGRQLQREELAKAESAKAADAATIQESKHEKQCKWTLDECDIEGDTYLTDCGNRHGFESGSPKDNRYYFCSYCGGVLQEVMGSARGEKSPEEDKSSE